MFARADLLIFQNKAEESYIILDSIETMFTGHALADDIAFRRGTIEYKKSPIKILLIGAFLF